MFCLSMSEQCEIDVVALQKQIPQQANLDLLDLSSADLKIYHINRRYIYNHCVVCSILFH